MTDDAAAAPDGRRVARPGPVAYDVAGPPGAPAIVFIHGTRLTRAAWSPQMAGLSDEYRDDRPGPARPRRPAPTSRSRSTGAADRLAAVIDEAAGGRGDRRRAVARRLRGDGPRRALAGAGPRPGPRRRHRRADRPGPHRPYLALAWVLRRRSTGRRSTPSTAGSSGPGSRAAIADPIVAGGFWSTGGALRAARDRRPVASAPAGRLSRSDADHQRRVRPAVPARAEPFAGPPGTASASASPGRPTSPTSTGRPPSREAVRRFARSLGPAG